MPEIVDNKKVGEYIKELLKEKSMTQNDLANELHITKSAVSQNLNGKSTFDLQNLVKIASLFDISLDTLLHMKTNKDRDVISAYERMVTKGIEELKGVEPSALQLHQPDLYGKVFVEYVIEHKKKDMFTYLLEHKIPMYDLTHSSARDVLLKIIIYMLQEEMNGYLAFVRIYTNMVGSLFIQNEELEEALFKELNSLNDTASLRQLLTMEIETEHGLKNILKRHKKAAIRSNIEWVKSISKYQLDALFELLIENKDLSVALDDTLHQMILMGYKKGITILIESFSDNQLLRIRSNKGIAQKAITLVSQLSSTELLTMMIEKGIYNDLSAFYITLVDEGKDKVAEYVLQNYKNSIDYKRVALYLVQKGHVQVIKTIIEHFDQDTLDYLLSKSNPEEIETNVLLIKHGALFNTKYFNRDTAHKINSLLSYRMNGEEE